MDSVCAKTNPGASLAKAYQEGASKPTLTPLAVFGSPLLLETFLDCEYVTSNIHISFYKILIANLWHLDCELLPRAQYLALYMPNDRHTHHSSINFDIVELLVWLLIGPLALTYDCIRAWVRVCRHT
jgi:hypothetical protein